MTHNFWGPEDGNIFGDIVVGHGNVVGTGIDALLYGHPHSDDGVVLVPDGDRTVSIIGPGAMLRNTIAEHDVTRRPKIAITAHDSDGNHEVITAAIPHAAPELVFDLEKHERVKKERAAEERFILELSRLQATTKSPEEILESAGERFSPRVLTRTREFLAAAEAEVA
jgi:acyl-CoA synthetase (AMP-forming)/AMP-acid ligase II